MCFQEKHAQEVRRNKELMEELTAWAHLSTPTDPSPHTTPSPYLRPPVPRETPSHPATAALCRKEPLAPHPLSCPAPPRPAQMKGIDPAPLTNSIFPDIVQKTKGTPLLQKKRIVFDEFKPVNVGVVFCKYFLFVLYETMKSIAVCHFISFSLYLSLLVDVLFPLSLSLYQICYSFSCTRLWCLWVCWLAMSSLNPTIILVSLYPCGESKSCHSTVNTALTGHYSIYNNL